LSLDERYTAYKKLYFGSASQDIVIEGMPFRAFDSCFPIYAPFMAIFTNAGFERSEWTTSGGTPTLIMAGTEDVFAPLATNGLVYKSFSPDTVTLIEIPGGGHMLNWEKPDLIAKHTKEWLVSQGFYDDLKCSSWCNHWTCDLEACTDCGFLKPVETGCGGDVCLEWCNAHTCDHPQCKSCSVCPHIDSGRACHRWCNAYTCSDKMCNGCDVCQDQLYGRHCGDWCNEWTCGTGILGKMLPFFVEQCGDCDFCE